MRVLLDECAPRRLRAFLTEHELFTVPEMGWSGQKNGALLRLAADAGFDVLLTVDQGVAYQQNPHTLPIAMLVLVAPSNRLQDLVPFMDRAQNALSSIRRGDVVRITA